MTWLAVSGAVFIVWLILVFLFTPGINYRLARRTSIHDADFLYTIQSTCQTALHHGNAVTVYTNGEQFYPAMLDAIRGATRSINMECYIFRHGTMARRFIDALSARARNGVNVTIVKANVDHLMAITALAVAKGFSKINFQFTTPFGRAWEDVVPPLEEAANAVMRVIDRYANEIDIHVINAQFCVFPGYERWVVGDLQKMGRTMIFAADPRFPEQVNLYEWLGARRSARSGRK